MLAMASVLQVSHSMYLRCSFKSCFGAKMTGGEHHALSGCPPHSVIGDLEDNLCCNHQSIHRYIRRCVFKIDNCGFSLQTLFPMLVKNKTCCCLPTTGIPIIAHPSCCCIICCYGSN